MLCWMPDHRSLNDIVLFEVPTRSGATGLLAELSSSHLAWMERGDEVAVVGVLLNGDDGDLACLLRGVETMDSSSAGCSRSVSRWTVGRTSCSRR